MKLFKIKIVPVLADDSHVNFNDHAAYIGAGMLTFEQAQTEASKRDDYNPAAWVRPDPPHLCHAKTFDDWLARAGVWREPFKKYWLSWRHTQSVFGPFEISSPWWETGEDVYGRVTICGAVLASNSLAAMLRVSNAYDEPLHPNQLRFRFVDEKSADWTPYSERFPRSDWMVWK